MHGNFGVFSFLRSWNLACFLTTCLSEHRAKTYTNAPGWAFPVPLSSQISSLRGALGFTLCAVCGSVVLLNVARIFGYLVVIEISFMDNQAQITETISWLDYEKVSL